MIRSALLCLLLSTLSVAVATTFRAMSPGELAEAADLVFTGTVRSSDVTVLNGEPWTEVVFEVDRLLLDSGESAEPDGTVLLRFMGGSLAERQLNVALMPQFSSGEQVLVFAYDADYWSPLVGFNQGVFWLSAEDGWRDLSGMPLGVIDDSLVRQPGSEAATVSDFLADLLEAR